MNTKPTSGPYFTRREPLGTIVSTRNEIVATFWERIGGEPKAEANSRAWVDGMAAMETIRKIRAFEREFSESRMNAYQSMTAIAGILDEAKP